jgi:hypothetical protein
VGESQVQQRVERNADEPTDGARSDAEAVEVPGEKEPVDQLHAPEQHQQPRQYPGVLFQVPADGGQTFTPGAVGSNRMIPS